MTAKFYKSWDKQIFNEKGVLIGAKLVWWVNISYHKDWTKTVSIESKK